jgi:hypothetical protein
LLTCVNDDSFFSIGGLVTSQARSFGVFILGRVITGIGGAVISKSLLSFARFGIPVENDQYLGKPRRDFGIRLVTPAFPHLLAYAQENKGVAQGAGRMMQCLSVCRL